MVFPLGRLAGFRLIATMKLTTTLALLLLAPIAALANDKPNIIVIMCDDLGFGDIHCMAPETCKIKTPGADRLAREGMIFTDAHSGSSVCTPTRYGLLTGRYSWRTRLQKGVVQGFAPELVAPMTRWLELLQAMQGSKVWAVSFVQPAR